MSNIVTEPPFANDPPVKINVNAKILGLVIGILAALGALFSVIGLIAVFSVANDLNRFCNAFGSSCGGTVAFGGVIGYIIIVVGNLLGAFGGFRMYQLNRSGKDLVIYGLILSVIGSLVTTIGYGSYGIGSFIFSLVINFVIYYLVVVSRFPGEAPLAPPGATAWGGGGPSAPPPPPTA